MQIVFTIQEWLIVFACLVLLLCVSRIHNLKKSIAQGVQRYLSPQLILLMDKKSMCFNLKNEGSFFVQNIHFDDSEVSVADYGFEVISILRFEDINFLGPKESVQLGLKVFDKGRNFLPEATERIFWHLVNVSFTIGMTCRDMEGRYMRFIFSKQGDHFFSEKVNEGAGESRLPLK
ncbi:MAG: hypothetical protein PHI60_08140 [Candidatus Omnitrophica bacterium]|nr:hypothetical protein [Candidatus Omnitrophota bacterium]